MQKNPALTSFPTPMVHLLKYSNIWANLRESHLLQPGETNSGFQKSLHYHCKEMINIFPNLKNVFPEPPILSYRRSQNLGNLPVRSSFNRLSPCHTASNSSHCQKSRCKLCQSMSNNNSVLDTQSEKTCYTSGGQCTTTNTIYAAECTQHKSIYVGQSSQKFNMRFDGHRSDVNVKPKACELAQHLHESHECDIKKDLKVYILQDNVIGSREKKEFY